VIPATSDFLTSLSLIMVAEVEARVVIKKMEGRAEDWKAGRFPSPATSQCFGSFVSLHLADQGWSEENVGFVRTAGALSGVVGQIPGGPCRGRKFAGLPAGASRIRTRGPTFVCSAASGVQ